MPPIPTTLGSEITNVVDAVRRRVFDLSKYQIPRLRDCHGPLATQQQYAAEVREDTELLSRQVEVSKLENSAADIELLTREGPRRCSRG